MSRLARNSWLFIAMALLCACGNDPVTTTTVVIGSVTDGATGEPVAGAEIDVVLGPQTKASALSDSGGSFQVQFETPVMAAPQSFALLAQLDGYRDVSLTIEINNGKAAQPRYPVRLVPDGLALCMQRSKPAVVVGHFRPAPGRPDPNLSKRIADTLRFDLMEEIQKAEFNVDRQPGIFPCDAAEPKVPGNYGTLAKLLGADAFIGGYVTSPNPVKVKVELSVADGYGVLEEPLTATSADFDLDDPRLAKLAPEANAAILTALVIGYKLSDKPQECVDLVAASERLLGTLPPALVQLREECQSVLPNRGLL